MMTNLDTILTSLRGCSDNEKRVVISELRKSVFIHPLEQSLGVRAEIILEAIHRASDLTQRGVRGLVAELTFVMDVLPLVKGWKIKDLVGNFAYDAVVERGQTSVRIQVKMQRSAKGLPKKSGDRYVAEVQKTRSGERAGEDTRPYRFGDFDLLAVCMRASTGNWHSFMYASADDLVQSRKDARCIETMQTLPPHPEDKDPAVAKQLTVHPRSGRDVWTDDLNSALARFLPEES